MQAARGLVQPRQVLRDALKKAVCDKRLGDRSFHADGHGQRHTEVHGSYAASPTSSQECEGLCIRQLDRPFRVLGWRLTLPSKRAAGSWFACAHD